MNKRIKGVIFDMDGVLFDTERIYQECWWATALRFDDDPDPSFPKTMCGTGKGTGEKVIATYFPKVDIKEFENYCYSLYSDTIAKKLPEKPGVREILDYFRKLDIPIAVASSSPSDIVESNLTRAAGCSPVMIVDTMKPDRELAAICIGVFESLAEAQEAIRQETLTR